MKTDMTPNMVLYLRGKGLMFQTVLGFSGFEALGKSLIEA